MTGIEWTVVSLFAVFCASITACSIATSRAAARVEVAREHARAHVEAHRVVAEAQHGPLTVPRAWTTPDGES